MTVLTIIALLVAIAHSSEVPLPNGWESIAQRLEAIQSSLGSHHRGFQTLEEGNIRSMLRDRQQLLRGLVRDGHIHSAFQYIPLSPLALHRAMRILDGGGVEEVAQTWVQLGKFSDSAVLGLPPFVYPGTRDDKPGVTRLYADNASRLVGIEPWTTHIASPVRIADLGDGVHAVSDTFLHPITEEEFQSHTFTEIVDHCPNGTSRVYGEHDNVTYIFCDHTHREFHRPARKFHASQTSSSGFQFIKPKLSGVMNVLVVPVDFTDNAGYPVTGGSAQLSAFYGTGGEMDRFFRDNSQGILGMKATIAPLVRAPRPMSFYNTYNNYLDVALDECLQQASLKGYNPRLYDQWVIVTKYVGLGYSGISYVGSCGTHTNGQLTYLHATAHEFGHNMGFNHAHAKAPFNDYGNTLEMMGYSYGNVNPHFGARNKLALGWLKPDFHVIKVERTSGTYRLYCHDHAGAYGHRLIQLGYPHQNRAFFIEYRYMNGFGSITTSAKWPYGASLIESGQGMVKGALVVEDQTATASSDSTLIDSTTSTAASSSSGHQVDASVAVGKTYVIGQEGVSTNTVFATMKVLGAGGSNQDSYIDIQLSFGTTDVCPFPVKYPTEVCNRVCTYTQGYAISTILYFMGTERAWSFVVSAAQKFTGIAAVDLFVYGGSMTSTTISVWTNSNSNPGTLLAKASYGTVVSQTAPRVIMATNDALYKLQLNPGTYWLSFTSVQTGSNTPYLFYSPTVADGLPSKSKSGSSWVTDSPACEVYVAITGRCTTAAAAPTRIGVREIPTSIAKNTRFPLTMLYMDAAGNPAKPPAGRTLRTTIVRKIGLGSLSGVTTATTTGYSAAVTIPQVMITSGGTYQIDISDGYLSVRSPVITVPLSRRRMLKLSEGSATTATPEIVTPSEFVFDLTTGAIVTAVVVVVGFLKMWRHQRATSSSDPESDSIDIPELCVSSGADDEVPESVTSGRIGCLVPPTFRSSDSECSMIQND